MTTDSKSATVLHRVTLLPGAWVGPETCSVMQDVIAATGVLIEWERFDASMRFPTRSSRRSPYGSARTRAVSGFVPRASCPVVHLRQTMGSWCMMREERDPRHSCTVPDIDVMVIREASEGIYTGMEHAVADGVRAIKVTTRAACERIARHLRVGSGQRPQGQHRAQVEHHEEVRRALLRTAQQV